MKTFLSTHRKQKIEGRNNHYKVKMNIIIIGLFVSLLLAIVWGYFRKKDISLIINILLFLAIFLLLISIKFNLGF